METYAAEISEVLQKYGSCVLPGIGKLELIRFPAERSFQHNTLTPPSFKIVLSTGVFDLSDPSVVDQIAVNRSLSRDEAKKQWDNALENIKAKLSTGSSVSLDGLGLLNLGDRGEISFISSFPSALFYSPVPTTQASGQKATAEQVELPEPVPPVAEANTVVPDSLDLRAQSRARWWIAGSIVILLLIGWFTYMGTKVREKKQDTLSEILNQQPVDQSRKLDSMQQSIDSMRQAHKLANDSIHYNIVIATYDNKDKAEHQYRKMRGWGHPVVLLTKDSIYELAWPFTSLPADTTVNMVKMMNLYGKDIHIEYDNP